MYCPKQFPFKVFMGNTNCSISIYQATSFAEDFRQGVIVNVLSKEQLFFVIFISSLQCKDKYNSGDSRNMQMAE